MTTVREALTDLQERLASKIPVLKEMAEAEEASLWERKRLQGKAQGIDVALSYVGEALRALPPEETVRCFRCCGDIPVPRMTDSCERAPDGGSHEGYAPAWMCPTGFTTHGPTCPRAQPIMIGRDLVDAPCLCRGAPIPETVDHG